MVVYPYMVRGGIIHWFIFSVMKTIEMVLKEVKQLMIKRGLTKISFDFQGSTYIIEK